MTLWLSKELDLMKLRRRQLGEQIGLRYQGLNRGVLLWETTIELGFKLFLYAILTAVWCPLGALVEKEINPSVP